MLSPGAARLRGVPAGCCAGRWGLRFAAGRTLAALLKLRLRAAAYAVELGSPCDSDPCASGPDLGYPSDGALVGGVDGARLATDWRSPRGLQGRRKSEALCCGRRPPPYLPGP